MPGGCLPTGAREPRAFPAGMRLVRSLRGSPRNLEPPVVPGQWVVPSLVLRPPHLDAPDAKLDVRVSLLDGPEEEDAIRKEIFVEHAQPPVVTARDFRDEERRRPEGPQEAEEMKQLPPRVL